MKMAEEGDLKNQVCSICYDSNNFRVLHCRHAFCLDCIEIIHKNHEGRITCPRDRIVDVRVPSALPTLQQFKGKISMTYLEKDVEKNFGRLQDDLVKQRMQTIKHLRNVTVQIIEKEILKLSPQVPRNTSLTIGSVMTIVGLGLSYTGVGAVVGVPLALLGIGIAGGAATGLAATKESNLRKNGLQEVQEDLALDSFKSEQIKVLLMRAAMNRHFAKLWQIDHPQFYSAGNILRKSPKLGVTTTVGARVPFGMGLPAAPAGLHLTSFVLAAAMIPLDLTKMIVSMIKVHKKKPPTVVKDIVSIADKLEKQLWIFLIGEGYFQFIYTKDGYRAYIILHAEKMMQFKDQSRNGFTLAELKKFGEIIEYSRGEVTSGIRNRIQNEWFSHMCQQTMDADGGKFFDWEKTVVINENEPAYSKMPNVTLEVRPKSVDYEVILGIRAVRSSEAPPIPCDFGEMVLSEIIEMKPLGVKFKIPAVLSIKHSAVKLPELSSVVIKGYDHEKKKWVTYKDENGANLRMEVTAKISITSFFVAFLSLDIDTHTVSKSGSTVSPFAKDDVKIIFEERTFGDYLVMLDFKMNVFSEKAIRELNHFGLEPILFLHVKERSEIQPIKPVTLKIPMLNNLERNDVFVICGNNDANQSSTEVLSYETTKNFLTVRLAHFTLLSIVRAKVGTWINEYIMELFRSFAGPLFLTNICVYKKGEQVLQSKYYVGCCGERMLDQLDDRMHRRGYRPLNISLTELFSNTRMTLQLAGRYQIINEPVMLKFVSTACTYTDEFQVEENDMSDEKSKLIIFKEGEEIPLKTFPFDDDEGPQGDVVATNAGAESEDRRPVHVSNSTVVFGNVQSMPVNPCGSSAPQLCDDRNDSET